MIKNIILDMGNVLLEYNPKKMLQTICADQESRDILYKELFQGPEWVQGDKGLIKNHERFIGPSKRVPVELHDKLQECVDTWYTYMTPIEGAMEFCQWARERGIKLYVLSNACGLFHQYFPTHYPLELFEGVVVSADVRMIKPDAKIYEHIIEKYNLVPEETLFIDDMPYNAEGAKAVGLQAMVFENDYEEVKKLVKSL